MDHADRLQICRLVAGILHSDDAFVEAEQSFLRRVYTRFGLPSDSWHQIVPIPAGAASAALRQLPVKVQTKVVALLVEAAIADGVVCGQERAYLLVAAAALGIDAHEMELRIVRRLEKIEEQGAMSNP